LANKDHPCFDIFYYNDHNPITKQLPARFNFQTLSPKVDPSTRRIP